MRDTAGVRTPAVIEHDGGAANRQDGDAPRAWLRLTRRNLQCAQRRCQDVERDEDLGVQTLSLLKGVLELDAAEIEDEGELWFEAASDTLVVVRSITQHNAMKIEVHPQETQSDFDVLGLLITNEMMSELGGPYFGFDPIEGGFHTYSIVPLGDTPPIDDVIDAVQRAVNLVRNYDPSKQGSVEIESPVGQPFV